MTRRVTTSTFTGIRPGYAQCGDSHFVASATGNRKQRRAAAKLAAKKTREPK